MNRLPFHLITAFLLVLMIASTAPGSNLFPLEPPDTSSPRATLESFLYYSEVFHKAMRTPKKISLMRKRLCKGRFAVLI